MKMSCDNIIATSATQVRVKLNKEVIDQYHEDLDAGAIFPPISVFREDGSESYWLGDGFHRLFAAIHAGHEEIDVEVHEGGKHEALIYALGANAGHGLRRTNADKRNAVKIALADPAISQLSQQEIADICRVERHTVSRISRRELLDNNSNNENNGTKFHEPEENKPENVRPTKPEPTQEEHDRREFREALAMIRVLPYGGAEGYQRLNLSGDMKEINDVIDWLTEVLEEHVRCQHQETDMNDGGIRIGS